MKKTLSLILGLILLVSVTFADEGVTINIQEKMTFDTLETMIQQIKGDYYKDIDDQELMTAIYKGLMEALDEHSTYFTPEEFDRFSSSLQGSFSGVGISISPKDGYIEVIAPIKGTPGDAAGILPGDLIIAVDGVDIKGMVLEDVVSRIRGPVGQGVVLTIQRQGLEKAFDVEIIRAIVEIKSVEFERQDDIGIVSISSFDENTADILQGVLNQASGLKGLIIDLRNNPGGYLDQAVTVSDMFLEEGKKIVSVDYKSSTDFVYNAIQPGNALPLVVLVNEGSASASEIFAAAIQQNDRGLIVGTQTYGKGTIQSIRSLPGDSAMKLTIGEYLPPNNESIHGVGVTPDVVIDNMPQSDEAIKTFYPMNSLTTSKFGSRDIDTYGLQERLNYLGYSLAVDGSFGRITESTLKAAQKDLGLPVTGVLSVDVKIAIEKAVQEKALSKPVDEQLAYALNYLK